MIPTTSTIKVSIAEMVVSDGGIRLETLYFEISRWGVNDGLSFFPEIQKLATP